jgi:hypothetical protein
MIRTRNFSGRNESARPGNSRSRYSYNHLNPLDLIRRVPLARLAPPAVFAFLAGCGGPKEAENPRELLGPELTHEGVYGGGSAPDRPGAAAAESPSGSADKGTARAVKPDALATRADCESAARHLVALGIEIAIREETDPEKKQRLIDDRAAALESERARAHRAQWARECLEDGTLAREARCIARIQSERDIERCVGEP